MDTFCIVITFFGIVAMFWITNAHINDAKDQILKAIKEQHHPKADMEDK